MQHKEMLTRLYSSLPKGSLSKERFEMPAVESLVQGPKTLIKNFDSILKTIRRERDQVLKFLTKELATAASTEEDQLVLKGKFDQAKLQKALNYYIEKFVLCSECKKPDTKLIDQKGVQVLKCEACGAASPVQG